MIDRIVIENFKSLRKVDLALGRMNLFIGTNASGKSNFLDALRVLQGIGNGFTIGEILDGKPKSATSAVWEGVRGGSAMTRFAGSKQEERVSVEAYGRFESQHPWAAVQAEDPRLRALNSWPTWALSITFSPGAGQVTHERFSLGQHVLYDFPARSDSDRMSGEYKSGTGNRGFFNIDTCQPVLGQFAKLYARELYRDCPREHPQLAARTALLLANVQHLDPEPGHLRRYSEAPRAQRMGDYGENFAALIDVLDKDDKSKNAYLSWLQELRPEEVTDVGVQRGALDEPLFMLRENGREFPAPVLSDGTLRFAALAAAFFQPDMPRIMTIEEIENGVHPSRLRLLMELFRSQTERTGTQIVATTHSPLLLEWLREEEYETTFFCRRNEETGESEIRPLTEVPRLLEVLKKPGQKLAELFSEGWLEAAL